MAVERFVEETAAQAQPTRVRHDSRPYRTSGVLLNQKMIITYHNYLNTIQEEDLTEAERTNNNYN